MSISKVTDDIVRKVSPGVEVHHIPHAVDAEVYKPIDDESYVTHKKSHDSCCLFSKEIEIEYAA